MKHEQAIADAVDQWQEMEAKARAWDALRDELRNLPEVMHTATGVVNKMEKLLKESKQ